MKEKHIANKHIANKRTKKWAFLRAEFKAEFNLWVERLREEDEMEINTSQMSREIK